MSITTRKEHTQGGVHSKEVNNDGQKSEDGKVSVVGI